MFSLETTRFTRAKVSPFIKYTINNPITISICRIIIIIMFTPLCPFIYPLPSIIYHYKRMLNKNLYWKGGESNRVGTFFCIIVVCLKWQPSTAAAIILHSLFDLISCCCRCRCFDCEFCVDFNCFSTHSPLSTLFPSSFYCLLSCEPLFIVF